MISYSFKRKAVWYRVAKVGTRSIKSHLEDDGGEKVLYASQAPYLPSLYKQYYKFAFVREPIDRFVSGWKDKVLERNYYNFDETTLKKMSEIDNFIEWVEKKDINKCDEHIRSQSALIDLDQVDFIGRFENFNNDLKIVLEKLEINHDHILHENSTKKRTVELSEIQKSRILAIYKDDYQNFYKQ